MATIRRPLLAAPRAGGCTAATPSLADVPVGA
jgi:hypothetical protein